jgi:hypothetical protein
MAKQIDPRAHEKEIQRQQAVQNTIDAKVKAHQALTDSDIQFICPVAFKQTLSDKEKATLGLLSSLKQLLCYVLQKKLIMKKI